MGQNKLGGKNVILHIIKTFTLMNKQTHSIRYALPALLLTGASLLTMQGQAAQSLINDPPEDEEGEIIITLEGVPVQENPSDTITIFPFAEKMPEFPGGSAAMFTYIRQSIQYPKKAEGQEGRVILQFVIDTLGQMHDVRVVRSRHPALNAEAVRVVQSMPAWIPGEHNGRKVPVRYTLPVAFEATYDFDEVEVKPEFPGGQAALFQFLSKNIRYPVEAAERGVQGRVVVGFTITDQGYIEDVLIVKSVSLSLDLEAARLVRSMPAWTPGQMNGQPVHVKSVIPVNFNVQ